MASVRAFDDVEYQQRLERRVEIERVLAEHELPAEEATATAVLTVVEGGVEVLDEHQRPAGLRPAGTSDVAALLDSYGVGAASDAQVLAVAEQVRRVDAQISEPTEGRDE